MSGNFTEWIGLGEPTPRDVARQYVPFQWPASGLMQLEDAGQQVTADAATILMRRRSHRRLSQASMKDLSALLSLSCRTLSWGSNSLGFYTTLRPAPSAGAIHPIHLLVSSPDDEHWLRYLPDHHSMQCLDRSILSPDEVRMQLRDVCEPSDATMLLFVGEPGKTAAKYANPCSLIWRDAGNLQGFIALAAEVLSLGYCQLGITGEQWARKLDEHGHLVGVGVGLLGVRL
ncbi:hypothetical protein JAB1_24700 [Janthinobacterium sp. MP5059B]|nr:hypothetical protein JAB1_24700 [Janthinobacterium sp. MP5059B]